MEVKMEMGNFVLHLPVEITTDIFSRLPVDSVIRCKLVCKAWRSFVEDPVFLDIHTHRLLLKPAAAAAAVTTNTEFYLTVWPPQENRQKHHFLECNNHEMSNTTSSSSCFKLSKPLNTKDDDDDPFPKWYHKQPIGSSNGLICSYGMDRGTIFVYNPCTRECICLPPPIFKPTPFKAVLSSGFGYNPLTNEYKVVLIRPNCNEEGKPQPGAEVCVHTLGSGKWRRTNKLESWRLNVSSVQSGVFFNGALHWIARELINIDHYDIFSFDLANEEFRIIVPSPPLSRELNNFCCVGLGLWGGCCLCVRQWNHVTKTTDIWMLMNNSKDKDMIKSWTMKFKIPDMTNGEENKLGYYYYPVSLLGRDKILLYTLNEPVFVSYDSETGIFEGQVIDDSELQPSKSNWGICSVTPYTKSFVSPKAFREEEDVGLCF